MNISDLEDGCGRRGQGYHGLSVRLDPAPEGRQHSQIEPRRKPPRQWTQWKYHHPLAAEGGRGGGRGLVRGGDQSGEQGEQGRVQDAQVSFFYKN